MPYLIEPLESGETKLVNEWNEVLISDVEQSHELFGYLPGQSDHAACGDDEVQMLGGLAAWIG